jgi:hypothetical protein
MKGERFVTARPWPPSLDGDAYGDKRRIVVGRHKLLVFTNAVKGRDEEFNDWYTNQHVPDALSVPGYAAAQRFRLADVQMGAAPDSKWRYLAIYEVETDDLKATSAESMARAGTERMPLSDAADSASSAIFAFTPIGPRVTAEEVRARRSKG